MKPEIPMRQTGADQSVVVMKSLEWGWSEGADMSRLGFSSTRNGMSQGPEQTCSKARDMKSRMRRESHVRLCVQRRLACSAGDKPAGVGVRAP